MSRGVHVVVKEEINSPANILTSPCSPFQIEGVLHSIPCFSLSQKTKSVLLFLQITVEICCFYNLQMKSPIKLGKLFTIIVSKHFRCI